MKIPVTMTPFHMMAIIQKLNDDGMAWDFRGGEEGRLHLFIDGHQSPHSIKLESYGSWTGHSEMEPL